MLPNPDLPEDQRWGSKLARIDVWWGGLDNNGDMLLLFAHLVSLNSDWSHAEIWVKTIASNAMTLEQTERGLSELMARCRIKARTRVLERDGDERIRDVIQRESSGADLVFMGLRGAAGGEEEAYGQRLSELIGDLPTVILVRAAAPFAGQLL